MSTHVLVEIPPSHWATLRDLYIPQKYLTMSYNLVHTLIRCHERNTAENFEAYSLDGDWQEDGTFVIIHKFTDHRHVYLNTLSDDMQRLSDAMNCLDTSHHFWFFGYTERMKPLIDRFYETRELLGRVDKINTNWFYATKEQVDDYEIKNPDGITVRDVDIKYVPLASQYWPHRYQGAEEYVEFIIRHCPSVGAYDESGNMIAWCLLSPQGGMTLLQVLEQHKRRGLGSLMVKHLAKKMSKMGYEVLTPIEVRNAPSMGLFKQLGFKLACKVYWDHLPTQ